MHESENSRGPPCAARTDEELLRLAQGDAGCEAAEALFQRYRDDVRQFVAQLTGRAGLQDADADAAEAAALEALCCAIRRYDLDELSKPNPCHFRTFLHLNIEHSFRDFLRREARARRRQKRCRRAALEALEPSTPSVAVHWLGCSPDWKNDPSLIAQEAEALADLDAAVAILGPEERSIVDGLFAGLTVADLARDLDQAAWAVGRDKERIITYLRACVRQHCA